MSKTKLTDIDWMKPTSIARSKEEAMNLFFFDTNPDTIFIRGILPDSYELIDCDPKSAIRCKSKIGIRHQGDSDDSEHWDYIEKAIRQYFGDRLQEIYFNTHAYFQDFTIYFK